ncbi:MAG: SAM-dependent DNA methyltransferase [Christensenellales bacterium]
MEKKSQIKSRQRVAERGEVFTNEREVKAMCDLVKDETERIESRFLEPACGDGNFLAEIVNRKLAVVSRRYGKSETDWEKYSVLAMSSIYGVDIMPDNAAECRERLFKIWERAYKSKCKTIANDDCKAAVRFILSRNVLCGDALTMLDESGNPIVFSEWSLVGNNMKRRDYTLANLLETQSYYDLPLFENVEDVKVPKPVKEYDLIHYRRVQDNA